MIYYYYTLSFNVIIQIRLVIEESLNQLPFTRTDIVTPTGCLYNGLQYQRGNCGVSIVRSGEVMEQVCSVYINSNAGCLYFKDD